MQHIRLRRFVKNDKKAVDLLHIQGLKQSDSYINEPEARQQLDADLIDIRKTYIKNGGEFIVATLNNKIIGMGALKRIDKITAEIKRMRVKPEFQGRGIGKMILDKLIEKAKEVGCKKLVLDTGIKQVPAQGLYQSRGFKEYKRGEIFGQNTIYYELSI
ncbi:MAG: GNAT family N-acetyltransferase [Patescibacteria group bacterium]|jgi:ribosomal protein S18 acetylase RimI-like enzyme